MLGYYALEESGAAFDADYQAVLDYGTLQGYTLPSAGQQILQNQIVVDLKAAGAWIKIDVLYILANDGSFEFGKINWKDPSSFYPSETGTPLWASNQGFIGGTTSATRLDTGYQPTVFTGNFAADDASFGVWIYDMGTDSDFLFGDTSRNQLKQSGTTTRIQAAASVTIPIPPTGWTSVERGNSSQFEVNTNGSNTTYSMNSAQVDNGVFILLNRNGQNVAADATMSVFYAGAYFGNNDVQSVIDTYMNAI